MTKYKFIDNKDKWMLAEHVPDIDFFFSQIWLSSFVNDLKNSCGKNYKKVLAIYDPKFNLRFYYGEIDSLNFEKNLVEKITKNSAFGFAINKNIVIWSDKLRAFSKKLAGLDFKKIENNVLINLLQEQDKIHTQLYEWGWLSNATDMFHASFTNELKGYLQTKLAKINKEYKLNEYFTALTSPHEESVALKEEIKLLKIADYAKKNSDKIKVNIKLDNHCDNYFYLKFLWLGSDGVYEKKYFKERLKLLVKDEKTPQEKIREIKRELIKIKKTKEEIFAELRISKQYRNIFSVYSQFMITKIYRRYAQIFWSYQIKNLLEESGRRLGITLEVARYLSVAELSESLKKGKLSVKDADKRLDFFIYYVENGLELLSTNRKHPILKQIEKKIVHAVSEFSGQIGCLGKAKGRVRIINAAKDMSKMRSGDILVSVATNPDLVPAMKKSAAIITEQGGVTSHAAIISREMKKPCIIGTKIATQVLKDGDLVEVDADKGVVRILKK